jgi:hypothetical protein
VRTDKRAAFMTERNKGGKLTPRAAFTAGLTEWFRGHRFNVGLNVQTGDAEKELAKIGSILNLPFAKLPVATFFLKGPGSEEIFDALIPLVSLSDILASKVDSSTAVIVPVIFADGLTPKSLTRRVEELLDCLALEGFIGVRIYPLLIYFDSAKASKVRKALLPDGFQVFGKVIVRVGIVSVAEHAVDWAAPTGLARAGEGVRTFFGFQADPFAFAESELSKVEMLSDQFAAKSVAGR